MQNGSFRRSHFFFQVCQIPHSLAAGACAGVRVFEDAEVAASGMSAAELAEKDLKATLEGLAAHLFGKDIEVEPCCALLEYLTCFLLIHPSQLKACCQSLTRC
jgi:hypothetical protein